MEKVKIKEIIIVEGRDDATAIKRVIDAHIIVLNGFSGMSQKTIKKLLELSKTNDMILFTDPDFSGKKIRQKIESCVPNIKHAFISRKLATRKNGEKINVGVENANDKDILEALKNVMNSQKDYKEKFFIDDLLENGLTVGERAKNRRILLGDILKIGYYNSKQLLNALNSFNITRENFKMAVDEIKRLENFEK